MSNGGPSESAPNQVTSASTEQLPPIVVQVYVPQEYAAPSIEKQVVSHLRAECQCQCGSKSGSGGGG